MGILLNIFGQSAVIRFEGYDFYGKKWTGKTPIRYFGCVDEEEITDKLKNLIFVEKGVRLERIKIIGYYET